MRIIKVEKCAPGECPYARETLVTRKVYCAREDGPLGKWFAGEFPKDCPLEKEANDD